MTRLLLPRRRRIVPLLRSQILEIDQFLLLFRRQMVQVAGEPGVARRLGCRDGDIVLGYAAGDLSRLLLLCCSAAVRYCREEVILVLGVVRFAGRCSPEMMHTE